MSIDKGIGILHYSDDKLQIYSKNNRFFAKYNGNEYSVELKIGFILWFLMKFRLIARLLRVSSSSVEPIFFKSGGLESIIISYNYGIYL
ncbi:hypothetical protein, partial [Vibrio sp. V10_P2A27P122]|uniref:hypothetical protein n=1 Tax=Vibrio sp. V10_P2A27P122 TaxID=1938665 RepID=UPI000B9F4A13